MSNPFLNRMDKKARGAHGRASERRVIKELGATAMPASGSLPGAKSDATLGRFRLELKATTCITLPLAFAWLEKISNEAQAKSQIPGVVVSFVDAQGQPKSKQNAEWVVIPRWAFVELLPEE